MSWCPANLLARWDTRWGHHTVPLTVLKIADDVQRDGRGFLAVPRFEPDRFIVVFRGVQGGRFAETARVWKSSFYGTRVHNGFLSNYKRLAPALISALELAIVKYPSIKKIHFSGFSMGGALATLALVDFRIKFPQLCGSITTFGSPRVGNGDFARKLFPKHLCGKSERYTNRADITVHLPPRLVGYRHVGKEIWNPVSSNPQTYQAMSNCDSMEATDLDRCANSIKLKRSIEDHSLYLGVAFDKTRGCRYSFSNFLVVCSSFSHISFSDVAERVSGLHLPPTAGIQGFQFQQDSRGTRSA